MAERQPRPNWEAANRRDRVNQNRSERLLQGPLPSHVAQQSVRAHGWTGDLPTDLGDLRRLEHMLRLSPHRPAGPPSYAQYRDMVDAYIDHEVLRGHRAIRDLRRATIGSRSEAADRATDTVRSVAGNLSTIATTWVLEARDAHGLAVRITNEVASLERSLARR